MRSPISLLLLLGTLGCGLFGPETTVSKSTSTTTTTSTTETECVDTVGHGGTPCRKTKSTTTTTAKTVASDTVSQSGTP